MRWFVIATAIIFALIFIAHIARVFAEGIWLLREPMFVITSVLSLAMTSWAVLQLIRRPR